MKAFKKLKNHKEFQLLVLIAILCIFISSRSDVFFTISNFRDVFMINSVLGIVSLGMTLCIITGGIDVSVAGMLACSLSLAGNLLAYTPLNFWCALVLCTLLCMMIGVANGFLISRFNIPPIVVTLGMLSILNGTILLLTKGAWINTSQFPREFIELSRARVYGIPIQIIIWVILIVLTAYIMKYTTMGRSIYALGGNQVSAERAGIKTNNVLMFVYTYSGFLCGIAGCVYMTIVQQVDTQSFTGYEMSVVAACVVGGASMAGGVGSVLGSVLGVVFMTLTNNGIVLAKISSYWQDVVIGVVILIAVTVDVIRAKNEIKRLPKIDVME